MKITGCETLHCGAGWRNFSFLKLKTDEGLTPAIMNRSAKDSTR